MLNEDIERSIKKEKVARIDETPTKIELTEALATKEYKLLGFERLCPAEDDVFIAIVQDTKPIDCKLGTLKNPIRGVFSEEPGKEINNKFFHSIDNLLADYFGAESDISYEIYKAVEKICLAKGYWWRIRMGKAINEKALSTKPNPRRSPGQTVQ